MIDYVQAFWLALVQGVTEFLPISSSAHLILVPVLFGWNDQGLAFDVAVHAGSLVAVMVYFRDDLRALLGAVPGVFAGAATDDTRLLVNLALATVPIVLAGLAGGRAVETTLRDPLVIAATMIGFALLLWYADRRGGGPRRRGDIGWRAALFIGIAQVLALVPGTSRSGITITAALLIGLGRVDAARFSFLLSIPTIIAAAALQGWALGRDPGQFDAGVFTLAVGVSFASAYLCIALFLGFINRIGMLPFVVYRLLLGAVLLVLFL